jgi:hypothetical protein
MSLEKLMQQRDDRANSAGETILKNLKENLNLYVDCGDACKQCQSHADVLKKLTKDDLKEYIISIGPDFNASNVLTQYHLEVHLKNEMSC